MAKKEDSKASGDEKKAEEKVVEKKAIPTPPAPKAKAPAPVPAGEQPAMVRLEVFLATNFKPDQQSGFRLWAKRQGHRMMTMKAWMELHEEFMKRPIGRF